MKVYSSLSYRSTSSCICFTHDPVIFPQITSLEHFQHVVSRALGADEAAPDGYQDAQGRWRHPHKLMIVEIYADWCRACKGLQPKLLKYIKKHPDVLCCKVNKAKNEARIFLHYLFFLSLPSVGCWGLRPREEHVAGQVTHSCLFTYITYYHAIWLCLGPRLNTSD